jgi:hypothetical protein
MNVTIHQPWRTLWRTHVIVLAAIATVLAALVGIIALTPNKDDFFTPGEVAALYAIVFSGFALASTLVVVLASSWTTRRRVVLPLAYVVTPATIVLGIYLANR